MDNIFDIDVVVDERIQHLIDDCEFEQFKEILSNASVHNKFYYLALLNQYRPNLTREQLFAKVKLLREAYEELFDPSLPFSTHNVHVCRFYFESATRIGEFRDKLLHYCSTLSNSTVEDRQHLVDILPRCDLKDTIMKSLQSLENQTPRRGDDVLYCNDKQSSHAVVIVTEDGKELCDRSAEFEATVATLPKELRELQVINDIRINNSTLHNIKSTFVHVLDIINNHANKYELMRRLKEELEEMAGTCTTGMNARLVNVLTGYTSELKVALPFESELKAVVYTRFNKRLSEASDTLRDMYLTSITDREKKPEYVLFKEAMRAELSAELRKEYETMPGFDSGLFNTAFSDAFTQV